MSDLDLGTLVVDVEADISGLDARLAEVEKKLGDAGDSGAEAGTTITAAFAAAAAAAAAFIGVLHASSEAQEAQIRLAQAIKASGASIDVGAINALGEEIQKLTVYDDDAVASATALAVRFGLEQDEIVKLMPLVADLAAMTDTDLTAAMEKAGMAIKTGMARSLKSAGIVLDETEAKTFKNADATTRLAMVMEKLEGSVGGTAAEMAKTADGAMAQMTNEAMNLAEALGDAFGPAIVDSLQETTSLVRDLKDLFGKLGGVTDVIVDVLTAPLRLLIKYQSFLMDFWGKAAELAGIDLSAEMELVPLTDAQGNIVGENKGANKNRARTPGGGPALDWSGMGAGAMDFDMLAGQTAAAAAAAASGLESESFTSQSFVEPPEAPALLTEAGIVAAQTAEQMALIPQAFARADLGVAASLMFQAELQHAALELGTGLVSRMGDFGSIVSSTMQAGLQGGPMAAVGTAALELLSRTESFGKITEILNEALGAVVKAVDPLMNAFIPLADAVAGIVVMVSEFITPIMAGLGGVFASFAVTLQAISPILEITAPLFEIFAGLMEKAAQSVATAAFIVLSVVEGIVRAWNFVLGVVSDVLWKIDSIRGINVRGLAESVDDAMINTSGFNAAMADLQVIMEGGAASFDSSLDDLAVAVGDQTAGATGAIEGLGEAADKATESLLNVPQGYKVERARFEATAPLMNTTSGGGSSDGGGTGWQMAKTENNIGTIIVQTNDVDGFWEKLKNKMAYEKFEQTGTPFGGNMYATTAFSGPK